MKRIIITLSLLLFAMSSASAGVHHFTTNPGDMNSLAQSSSQKLTISYDFVNGTWTDNNLSDNNYNSLSINLSNGLSAVGPGGDDFHIDYYPDVLHSNDSRPATTSTSSVPEPATMILMALGLAGGVAFKKFL